MSNKYTIRIALSLLTCACFAAPSMYAEKEPDLFTNLFHRANDSLRNNNVQEAITLYRHATTLNDSAPQVYYNMGLAYKRLDQHKDAIAAFKRATELSPVYGKAWYQLASAYALDKQRDNAIETYRKAVSVDPDMAEAHLELARELHEKEEHARALPHLQDAYRLQPDNTTIMFELANTLNTLNKTEDALELYLKLGERHPNNAAIAYNTAYTYKKLNRVDEAFPYYEKTLSINPDHTEAHFSLGLAHLVRGGKNKENWRKGWEHYEWRWKKDSPPGTERKYAQPEWDGSDLTGKTIYLYAEQGLGDTFQFVRYAKVVKEQYHAAKIIVGVQKPLRDIIGMCPYIDHVVLQREVPTQFDYYASLMSLPRILDTWEDTIPDELPYLYADEKLVAHWKEKLSADKNFKIGVCWQGNPNYSTPFLRAAVAAKSVSARTFAPLGVLPGVSVYSLQKMTGTDQLADLPKQFDLKTFDGDFDQSNGRFMDTAAVMKNLDLVITVDTSIAHISAGLGTRTWVLLPNPADWRWMLDRTDSPWYPGVHLFRQKTVGKWDDVIHAIIQKLAQELMVQQQNSAPKNPAQQMQSVPFEQLIDAGIMIELDLANTQDETRKGQLQEKLTQIEEYFHTVELSSERMNQMLQELRTLNTSLYGHIHAIKGMEQNISPLNRTFMQHVSTIALLNNMRTRLKEEIKTLYDLLKNQEPRNEARQIQQKPRNMAPTIS